MSLVGRPETMKAADQRREWPAALRFLQRGRTSASRQSFDPTLAPMLRCPTGRARSKPAAKNAAGFWPLAPLIAHFFTAELRKTGSPRIVCAAAILLLVAWAAHAAQKPSLPAEYSRWLNQEVVYLISDEERKAFLNLKTDAERDKFREDFWEVRNPVRGSKQNQFKEEHYKRMEYANANFGQYSNTPGWMTDQGRTYILFGKPESRQPFKGYGQIYPLELWMYANKTGTPSLPPFFYVLFFIPEDIGEFRFYRPIVDGPMKLVRGSQFRTNKDVFNFLKPLGGDIARAPFSLNPSEPLDTDQYAPNMSGEMVVSKIQNWANDSFELQRIRELRYLRAKVESWFMAVQEKPLDVSTMAMSDPEGNYWLDYAVSVDEQAMGRRSPDGKQLLVTAAFRLLNEKDELIVEDSEERAYPAFADLAGTPSFKPFLLASRLPLVPGKYKLEVSVNNREASRMWSGERNIEVIAQPAGCLIAGQPATATQPKRCPVWLSGPLLSGAVQPAGKPDAITPFQYFGAQFVPAAERKLSPATPLRVLFQVHVPGSETRNYQVEYTIAAGLQREVRRITDNVAAREFRSGALLKSKTIPLADLEPGDYRAVLNVRAEGSAEVLASSTFSFHVQADAAALPLYFLANYRAAANSAIVPYVRALESLSQRDEAAAADYLGQSLDRDSANGFAARTLVQLYFTQRKFDPIAALFNRLGVNAFIDAPESMAQVALSLWRTNQRELARRVLESAEATFPKNTLLAAVRKQIM